MLPQGFEHEKPLQKRVEVAAQCIVIALCARDLPALRVFGKRSEDGFEFGKRGSDGFLEQRRHVGEPCLVFLRLAKGLYHGIYAWIP